MTSVLSRLRSLFKPSLSRFTRRCVREAKTNPYKKLGSLRTMKLDSQEFVKLFTPELKTLIKIFEKYNHELRIAGGAVRDLLMKELPQDVDFATTATPTEMKEMFTIEHIRMLNNKGEKHGTITARINDKENFEVTTLRIDVVTDGRHADVVFTKDWHLDANRRDLTINAMFLSFDGTIYDYFDGRRDLDERKVKFVGDPEARIQEDFLRILRYFRFYGRIAREANTHEQSSLQAIRRNRGGLQNISGERLWLELRKILTGRFAPDILKLMDELGLLELMGFIEPLQFDVFADVYGRGLPYDPLPVTLLAGLLEFDEQIDALNRRLKLSKEEVKTTAFILANRESILESGDNSEKITDVLIGTPDTIPKVRVRLAELGKYLGDGNMIDRAKNLTVPKFPLSGYDLLEYGVKKGPRFSTILNNLKETWTKSRYTASRDDLLETLRELVTKK